MFPPNSLLALVLLAAPVFAQAGHEVFQSNGGERVGLFNSPSVGGTLGSPNFQGDLFYKGLPEFATVSPNNQVHLVSLENLFIATTDWPSAVQNNGPEMYDIGITSTTATTSGEHLLPDFFSSGSLQALISLGPTGLPHPCSVNPTTTCTNSSACPPGIEGYVVDVDFGIQVPVGGAATDLSGTAAVFFLPGGMTYEPGSGTGSCGDGNYVFVGSQSLDEHQKHPLGNVGSSITEGLQVGDPSGGDPVGPFADYPTSLTDVGFGFLELMVEPVLEDTATVGGYGPESGAASLAVDPSSGGLRLGARIIGPPSLAGGLVFTAASPALLPVPVSVLGLDLQISPIGFFNATLNLWSGTFPMAGIDVDADGVVDQAETSTPRIPVPAGVQADVYLQSFVFATGQSPQASTVWRTRFQ